MATRIAGVVLRASDRHLTARFYESLGLCPHEHQHGGPKHYEVSPLSPEYVVEIYQKSSAFCNDAIMIEVDSMDAAVAAAKEFGIQPKSEVKDTGAVRFVYITDPDGRDVMLIEKT